MYLDGTRPADHYRIGSEAVAIRGSYFDSCVVHGSVSKRREEFSSFCGGESAIVKPSTSPFTPLTFCGGKARSSGGFTNASRVALVMRRGAQTVLLSPSM